MNKLPFIVITLFMLASCGGKNNGSSTTEKNEVETQDFASLPEMLVDSLLHFRHHHLRTDILSRHLPDITREKASDIQLGMLEKELAAGKRQIGWKWVVLLPQIRQVMIRCSVICWTQML